MYLYFCYPIVNAVHFIALAFVVPTPAVVASWSYVLEPFLLIITQSRSSFEEFLNAPLYFTFTGDVTSFTFDAVTTLALLIVLSTVNSLIPLPCVSVNNIAYSYFVVPVRFAYLVCSEYSELLARPVDSVHYNYIH